MLIVYVLYKASLPLHILKLYTLNSYKHTYSQLNNVVN